jgi:hypothetical protein
MKRARLPLVYLRLYGEARTRRMRRKSVHIDGWEPPNRRDSPNHVVQRSLGGALLPDLEQGSPLLDFDPDAPARVVAQNAPQVGKASRGDDHRSAFGACVEACTPKLSSELLRVGGD